MAAPVTGLGNRPRVVEHNLELLTDKHCVRDVVKGILHTIFFHRLFPTLRPLSRDVLFPMSQSTSQPANFTRPSSPVNDIAVTLPLIDDADLEMLITDRANAVMRRLGSGSGSGNGGEQRANILVHFYEKKRKKASTGFAGLWGAGGSNEGGDVCWETWRVEVLYSSAPGAATGPRCAKSLRAAAMDVLRFTGEEKGHIPPITSAETNPFPYEIVLKSSQPK